MPATSSRMTAQPPAAVSTPLSEIMLRAVSAAARVYFQRMPSRLGKTALWERVVRPYLAWRPLEIEARLRCGARLHGRLDDLIHRFAYFFGVFEPAVTAVFETTLRPGDVVIDIGANVGAHTLLAARLVGPTGRVHAIEASPWIFERLQANLARNHAVNVTAYNLAVTDRPGPVQVFLHDTSNRGGTTILPGEAAHRATTPEAVVEGLPLGDIVPTDALRTARLIKIDVEGAEWLVAQGLRAALPLLRQDVTLLIEVTPQALAAFGATPGDFLRLFTAHGFAAFAVPNRYDPGFYIDPPDGPALRPLAREDFEATDILFRRPAPGTG
ncbi:MAG: FkbM family methyltransferase [Acetobacteraceae bacterium]|nr:FkbM family methyltransferase [Acetobacteraceae bacterium]